MENFETNKSPSEMRRNVSEVQSARYASALVRLMERSNDNADLVNAMNDFTKEIDIKSRKGTSDEQMSEGLVIKLVEFFKQQNEELKRF